MSPLNLITDPYDRPARLYPALLLVAPVVVALLALFSTTLTSLHTIGSIVLGFGGTFLLTELSRDEGKKREQTLFVAWGGIPSVSIFRHRDARLDPISKSRYHQTLATLVMGTQAPTVDLEQNDPAAADAIYTAWSHYIRVNTRDRKKFALLFRENVSYGFRRNVWGMRSVGIATSIASLGVCALRLYFLCTSTRNWDPTLACSVVFAAICLLLWLFRFTRDWVRVPADAYAERLAECTEALGEIAPPTRKTSRRQSP